MSAPAVYPEADTEWVEDMTHHDGPSRPPRRLTVTEVEPGNRQGREIRGRVRGGEMTGERAYATDHGTFHKLWKPRPVRPA